jgi:hypothetical protein
MLLDRGAGRKSSKSDGGDLEMGGQREECQAHTETKTKKRRENREGCRREREAEEI